MYREHEHVKNEDEHRQVVPLHVPVVVGRDNQLRHPVSFLVNRIFVIFLVFYDLFHVWLAQIVHLNDKSSLFADHFPSLLSLFDLQLFFWLSGEELLKLVLSFKLGFHFKVVSSKFIVSNRGARQLIFFAIFACHKSPKALLYLCTILVLYPFGFSLLPSCLSSLLFQFKFSDSIVQ